MGTGRFLLGVLALAVAYWVGATGARGTSQPALVVGGPGTNEGPAASERWLAWMHGQAANPTPPASRTAVLVRQGDGRPWRANPPGTYAQTGGIVGKKLIIQLMRGASSRLASVNLDTRRLSLLPATIDRRGYWAWKPSASGRWVLYGRIDYAHGIYAVVLSNMATGELRVLDEVDGHGAYAAPGQVNGRYAVWIGCPDNHCRAYRYDVQSRRTILIPQRAGYEYWQFGPSVTADGTVYVGSGRGCADVRLTRWRNGRLATIRRFPPQTAFQYSFASGGDVYYDQVGCARDDLSSIYRLRG